MGKRYYRTITSITLLVVSVIFLFHVLNNQESERAPTQDTASEGIQMTIDGRWTTLQASLGLPSRRPYVVFPGPPPARAARFDLRRRRHDETQLPAFAPVPQLRIVPEALERPKASLSDIATSFNDMVSYDKIEQDRRTRIKSQSPRSQGKVKGTERKRVTT